MKKFLKRIAALALVVVGALSLASCDKSSSIKKAYEKEEYSVSETTMENVYNTPIVGTIVKSAVEKEYTEKQRKEIAEYSIIFAYKGTNYALIVKFPGSGDVKDFLTTEDSEGKKDTSAYDSAKDNGNINGNCLLLVASTAAKEIFK